MDLGGGFFPAPPFFAFMRVHSSRPHYGVWIELTFEERELLDRICRESHFTPYGMLTEFIARWLATRKLFRNYGWAAPPNPACELCGDRPGFTFYARKWWCRECWQKNLQVTTAPSI